MQALKLSQQVTEVFAWYVCVQVHLWAVRRELNCHNHLRVRHKLFVCFSSCAQAGFAQILVDKIFVLGVTALPFLFMPREPQATLVRNISV